MHSPGTRVAVDRTARDDDPARSAGLVGTLADPKASGPSVPTAEGHATGIPGWPWVLDPAA
jgi:hypothetical protein